MSYIVGFFLKANSELAEAVKWYDEKQPGLGEEFEQEVFRKIDLILSNPLHYPQKRKFREAKIDVFPYLLVYKIIERKNMIVIVSVFHTSRHPKRKHR
jgi:plasmid stabilization system protein ParE